MNLSQIEQMDMEKLSKEELESVKLYLFNESKKPHALGQYTEHKRLLRAYDRVAATLDTYFPE